MTSTIPAFVYENEENVPPAEQPVHNTVLPADSVGADPLGSELGPNELDHLTVNSTPKGVF